MASYKPSGLCTVNGDDGPEFAPFGSNECITQGDTAGMTAYCAGSYNSLKAADEFLALRGGFARAGADDVALVGPPGAVFEAVQVCEVACGFDGEEILADKCVAFCPNGGLFDHPDLAGFHGTDARGNRTIDGASVVEDGIVVYGIPIGSDAYIKGKAEAVVDDAIADLLNA